MAKYRSGNSSTTSPIFQIGVDGSQIKHSNGNFQLRTSEDDGYVGLVVKDLIVTEYALIPTDVSQFNYVLSSFDDTIQKALDTLDDHIHPTTRGGTGQTSYTLGDMLYASAANTLSKLQASTDGYILALSSGVPVWSPSSSVSSVLASNVAVDTSAFNKILSASDNTAQKVFNTLDDHNHQHNSLLGISGDGYYHLSLSQVGQIHTQNTDTGTTSSSFTIDSDGFASIITAVNDGSGNGSFEFRNSTGLANVRVKDLIVDGYYTYINSTVVEIEDNILTLNSNVSGIPSIDAGLEVRRGSSTNASILWDETADVWKVGLVGSEVEIVTLSGNQILTNKTLTTPTIGSFVNAQHNHQNAAGGGQIDINSATTGALGATRGGTGLTSYSAGDIIYASAANTLSNLAKGTDGYVLTLDSGLPSWKSTGSVLTGLPIEFIHVGKEGLLSPDMTSYLLPTFIESDMATMGHLVGKAGTIKNLRIKMGTAPGTGQSVVFTVAINGVDTGLTITVSGTNIVGNDLTNTALVAIGDVINVKAVTSSLSAAEDIMISIELVN